MITAAPVALTYDLTTRPWLPVSLLDGTAETWSLQVLFARASEAKGLSEPSPLTYTAVMRYLIAILHRAVDGPADPVQWLELWDQHAFDPAVTNDYLDRWRHRFDLFNPEQPFSQVVFTEPANDPSPITRLLPERTSGNNATLFDHSWDFDPLTLDPGAAARALLTAQAYGFAGTGGMFKDSSMVAGYCLFLEGQTLFQTLMLNLQRYDDVSPIGLSRAMDLPWWETDQDEPIRPEGNRPLGLTDLLTWRARQIQLLPEPDGTVRRCHYRQWYSLVPGSITDPFKRYAPVQSGENIGKLVPQNFQPDRALWRDSYGFFPRAYHDRKTDQDVLRPTTIEWLSEVRGFLDQDLGRDLAEDVKPGLAACGLVNNQAKIFLWRADRLPLPLSILEDSQRNIRVEWAIQLAEAACNGLRNAAATYAREVVGKGIRAPAPEDVSREVSALRFLERYWAALDQAFPAFLRTLADAADPADAAIGWMEDLRRVATDAYFDATDQTITEGRRMAAQAIGSRTLRMQLAKALGSARAASPGSKPS